MSNENSQRSAGEAALQLITSRSSVKKFADEVPSRAQIETLLSAASRAPDHGRLAPWRFAVLQGASREILSRAMQAAFVERNPTADAETFEREGSKAFRSPVLIVVTAVTQEHPKVPEIEQWVAVGAAVQNLWTAAQAVGLGCAWKTGSHAYSAHVLKALDCAPTEKIIGFLHVGVPLAVAPVRPAEFADKTRWL
ncbi:MAG: nitroreductase [Sinobacteraceae bacterium]|nr:nitroreductase [Nevskiaceae bacterium]